MIYRRVVTIFSNSSLHQLNFEAMKKTILSVITTFLCLSPFAQVLYYNSDLYNENRFINFGRMYINTDYQKLGVKEVVSKVLLPKNNEVKRKSVSLLNKNGARYQIANFNKNNKTTSSFYYHLIDSVRYDKQFSIYKKDTFSLLNIFDSKGRVTEIQYLNPKQKISSSAKYVYNQKGDIQTYSWFNKKGIEKSKYEYSYYENGSKKETRYFNKGKLKKVYNFTCEPMGEVEKKVTQQNICKKRTYNADSSYFEINEGRDKKGKTWRRVVKYSKDSMQIEEIQFNKNDKEVRKYQYTYENKKYKTIQVFKKGKLLTTSNYTYSPNGLALSYQLTNAKGKVKFNQVYEYQYF